MAPQDKIGKRIHPYYYNTRPNLRVQLNKYKYPLLYFSE